MVHLDYAIVLAHNALQSSTVHYAHYAAMVLDEPGPVELVDDPSYQRARYPEHVGERIVRDRQCICPKSIAAQQQAASQSLLNRVQAVACRGAHDFAEQTVRIAEQTTLEFWQFSRTMRELVCWHSNRLARHQADHFERGIICLQHN